MCYLGVAGAWLTAQTIGVDVDNTTFAEVPDEVTAEYNRSRVEAAQQRREQGLPDVDEDEEDSRYQAHFEARRNTIVSQKTTELHDDREKHRGRPSRSRRSTSPRDDAVRAANDAARARREELKRRHSPSVSPPGSIVSEGSPIPARELRVPEDAADSLYELQLRAVMRKYFRHWHAATERVAIRRRYLEEQAEAFDRGTLLRQVFDAWQEKRWFALIERRTERRYNGLLMAKAWTTWVQRTAAIVQRTHEARQRILARKYFTAWREFVLSNAAKVKWFQLSGAFGMWRQALARRRALEQRAVEYHRQGLIHRSYWQWFYLLCGKLATRRHNRGIKEDVFLMWAEKAERLTQLNRMAEAFFRRRTLQVVFVHWIHRVEEHFRDEDTAEDHRDMVLQRRTLTVWHRAAQHAPLQTAMVEFVNDRVVYEHFVLWRERARNVIAAAELYKSNLLCAALRKWRLQTRERVLSPRLEETRQRTLLKRWVLQERLKLLQRENARRLARRTLKLFIEQVAARRRILAAAARRTTIARNRTLVAATLSHWRARLAALQEHAREAAAIHTARTAAAALAHWRDRLSGVRVMQAWAADARYYFVTHSTLQQWHLATHSARRARLKTAYHAVARTHRRNLAAAAFAHWRTRAASLQQLSDLAGDFDDSRLRDLAASALVHWHGCAADAQQRAADAAELNYTRLLRAAWRAWVARAHSVANLAADAERIARDRDHALMARYLRRWGMRFWDFSMLAEKGERLAERNDALRARAILRAWRDRARFDDSRTAAEPDVFSDPVLPTPGRGSGSSTDGFGGFSLSVRSSGRATGRGGGFASTPAVGFATPSWRSSTARRRPLLAARTPAGTPGSPSKRFSRFSSSVLGRLVE